MKTLIINYPVLKIGGIEQFIYELSKFAIKSKYKVIWVYRMPMTIDNAYKEILENIISCERNTFFKGEILDNFINNKDNVTSISFTPFDHQRILDLYNRYRITSNFTPIYIVANTKGRYYYIEEYFFGIIRTLLRKKMRNIMLEWVRNNQIRFFAELQAKSFEKKYDIKLENISSLLLPNINSLKPIDITIIKHKFRIKEFNIITISRFDFPHKNYLLGLIDSFAELKPKYPRIFLHIVGYGQDENIVIKKIKKLPNNIQKSIILHGSLPEKKIIELMKNMHLNISVAGSVAVGAINGVLSIPARNFCGLRCEVYGYLPNSIVKTASTEPGFLVNPYIEEVMKFSFEKYKNIVIDGFNIYNKRPVNPNYLFEINNTNININTHTLWFKILDVLKEPSYKIMSILKLD